MQIITNSNNKEHRILWVSTYLSIRPYTLYDNNHQAILVNRKIDRAGSVEH